MAVILAIDSAIGISSVAVWHGDKVAAYRENREGSMQSARLLPLIEQAMQEAGLAYNDLTHVACTTGPGSFTGIRIALATARGIAYAASIPSLGFTTLEVMAHAAGGSNVLSIINAGKGEVFYQYFGDRVSKPAIGKLEDILPRYPQARLASSVALPKGYATPAITFPRADALAELAEAQKTAFAARHSSECQCDLVPFYLRPPDAKPQIARDDK